jgi:hypothetical protein
LSLTSSISINKAKIRRLRPSEQEGLYLQYRLRCRKFTFSTIAARLIVCPQVVANVVFGRRRSARIEAEIARILGKPGWNEVVLEARSAVTGKSAEAIIEEMDRSIQERAKAYNDSFAKRMTDNIAGNYQPGNTPSTTRRAG